MSEFEAKACKVLGVMLFLLVVILGLQLIGCSCPIPEPPLEYEYIDDVNIENYA